MKITPSANTGAENHQTRSISVSLPPGEGLVLTGSVKVIGGDTQAALPLSMVLEELSGSEERRGSYSSVALGSIPRLTEGKDVIQLSKKQAGTGVRQAGEENPDSSLPNNSIESVATKLVKKTVFSLLSQMDNVPASRKKGDGENLALSKTNENINDVSGSNNSKVPESEEPCSPVRLTSCRLQSGDGSDMPIRPLSTGSDDQECTSQLSPSRLNKLDTACQPKAILHLDKTDAI